MIVIIGSSARSSLTCNSADTTGYGASGFCLYRMFSIQLPPAPDRIIARNIGSTAAASGAIQAPIECPMIATCVASNVALGVAPGQSLTSMVNATPTWAITSSSTADSRTLSRSAPRFEMLNVRNCSSPSVRLRRPPSGPSTSIPAKPARAK